MPAMVNTRRVADRRSLRFSSLGDVLRDVEQLSSGGPTRAAGNWTPGQVVDHVARIIEFSVDGFPVPRASLPLRIVGRLVRQWALTRPMRPGLKLPQTFQFMVPEAGVTWEAAVKRLQSAIARAQSQRMKHASPVLGRLTHAQWEQLHCRHAEMHLSFLHGESDEATERRSDEGKDEARGGGPARSAAKNS